MISRLTPLDFKDYQLIDSGNGYKLERFGLYTLARPEPQAVWEPSLNEDEWQKQTHAHFKRDKNNPEKGIWTLKKGVPEQWKISYQFNGLKLTFRLGLTAFKHIGIFPEQAANWNYIYDTVTEQKKLVSQPPKILNLFAYTGGASLAAKAAGADVTHVDSVKQVINWTNENMQLSGLSNIRWVIEDALKFVKREVKRGSIYQGIILDPPAYGRGPETEKWVLEDHINEMISCCASLLNKENYFLLLNLYSMGFSPMIAETLINTHFKIKNPLQSGDLYAEDQFGKKLPFGIFCRFNS
jgi:23S rRNA (cytosine1962-C5)-methyltransferase